MMHLEAIETLHNIGDPTKLSRIEMQERWTNAKLLCIADGNEATTQQVDGFCDATKPSKETKGFAYWYCKVCSNSKKRVFGHCVSPTEMTEILTQTAQLKHHVSYNMPIL